MYLKWGGIVTKCGKQPIDFREHDKGPELFFEVVIHLHREGCQFYLSVLGEQFTDYLGKSQTHKQIRLSISQQQWHNVHWWCRVK